MGTQEIVESGAKNELVEGLGASSSIRGAKIIFDASGRPYIEAKNIKER